MKQKITHSLIAVATVTAVLLPVSANAATTVRKRDVTPPVISAAKAANTTPYGTTITWTTDESATASVSYGYDKTYGLNATATAPGTTHSVPLKGSFLTPATTIHYQLKSTDTAGNVVTSKDQTLLLPGVPVSVVVQSPDGQPQAGALVVLDGSSDTTGPDGRASLQAGLGRKQVSVSYKGVSTHQSVSIAKSNDTLPDVQLTLPKQPLNYWMVAAIALGALLLLLIAARANHRHDARVARKAVHEPETDDTDEHEIVEEPTRRRRLHRQAVVPTAPTVEEPELPATDQQTSTGLHDTETDEVAYRDPAPVFDGNTFETDEAETEDSVQVTAPPVQQSSAPTAIKVSIAEPEAEPMTAEKLAERLKAKATTDVPEPTERLGAANFKPLSDIKPKRISVTAPPLHKAKIKD